METKKYRKYIGKSSWLAQRTRRDLSYSVFTMSKKNGTATIADLYNINRVLKKVELRESAVHYGCVGKKEELRLIGIGDASFQQGR